MARHDHSQDTPQHLIDPYVDAGRDSCSDAFVQIENLEPHIPALDIDCTGCCWTYLTREREYESKVGNFNRVKFGKRPDGGNRTPCYLDESESQNPQHGMLRTNRREGEESFSVMRDNKVFRLYTGDQKIDSICVGRNVKARLEGFSFMKPLKAEQIKATQLNYHNAALLEIHRQHKGQPSLKGKCEVMRPPPSKSDGVDKMSKKFSKLHTS